MRETLGGPVTLNDISEKDKEEFFVLADQWRRDTIFLSMTHKIVEHPSAKKIAEMGNTAIPLILESFMNDRADTGLLHIMSEITGEEPYSQEILGKIQAMANKWVEWGRSNGYIKKEAA